MLSDRDISSIEKMPTVLKKPVRIVLFTSDIGCKDACDDMREICRLFKARSGRLSLEKYDVVMDRDKSEHYGVTVVPALVVEGGEGQSVTFYGVIEDLFLELLISTITSLSEGKIWFPENVRRTLEHLAHDVTIRVFVESDCPQCRPVAETAIGLALESRLVSASIIVASDFPELIKRYRISTLPRTIFGENLQMDGHVTESEFLEMVFQAEGVRQGPEKKCLVCGASSPDIICANCKIRIQAEAVEHKLKSEKLKRPETL